LVPFSTDTPVFDNHGFKDVEGRTIGLALCSAGCERLRSLCCC
jgi:hypothetical protein